MGLTVRDLYLIFISFKDHSQDLSQHQGQRGQTLQIPVPESCSVCRKAVEQEAGWSRMEKLSQGALKARESLLPNPEL